MSSIKTTRTATHAEWQALAEKMSAPERRDAFLRGEIPCYDDVEGKRRVLAPATLATKGDDAPKAPAPAPTLPEQAPAQREEIEALAAALADDDDTSAVFGDAAAKYLAGLKTAARPAPAPAARPKTDRAALAALTDKLKDA